MVEEKNQDFDEELRFAYAARLSIASLHQQLHEERLRNECIADQLEKERRKVKRLVGLSKYFRKQNGVNRLYTILERWTKKKKFASFAALLKNTAHSIHRQNVLKCVIRRLCNASKSHAIATWRTFVSGKENKCLKESLDGERKRARRASIKAIVVRFKKKYEAMGWETWRRFIHFLRRRQQLVARTVKIICHQRRFAAFRTFEQNLNEIALIKLKLRRIVLNCCARKLSSGFHTLRCLAREKTRQERGLRKVFARITHRVSMKAVRSWREYAAMRDTEISQETARLDKLRTILRRLQHRQLSAVMRSWALFVLSQSAKRRLLLAIMRRLASRSLWLGFRSLRSFVDKKRHQHDSLRNCLLRLANRRLSVSFRAWRSNRLSGGRENIPVGAVAVREMKTSVGLQYEILRQLRAALENAVRETSTRGSSPRGLMRMLASVTVLVKNAGALKKILAVGDGGDSGTCE